VILADTNILVRSAYPPDPLYAVTKNAVGTLLQRGETLCIAPQNLMEFWSVVTRPPSSRGGLGMDVASAGKEIESINHLFHLLPYTSQVPKIWQRIVVTHNVIGKQTYDAHLAAMMQVHSVMSILTFNGGDFKRFPGITVLDPAQV
jgi:predicted nucleic acid-binding protein